MELSCTTFIDYMQHDYFSNLIWKNNEGNMNPNFNADLPKSSQPPGHPGLLPSHEEYPKPTLCTIVI